MSDRDSRRAMQRRRRLVLAWRVAERYGFPHVDEQDKRRKIRTVKQCRHGLSLSAISYQPLAF